jgi:Holliday junction resolvasome RuvABC endonuclease subunit
VAKVLNRLHGVVLLSLYRAKPHVSYTYYAPNVLKVNIAGKKSATKQEVMDKVVDLMKNDFSVAVSPKDDNESDAIGLGIIHLRKQGFIK